MAFDVRRMGVLRAVAHCGSFSGAADLLSYSPSAVSQQIRLLEAEVGVPLIERGGRSMLLTDAGQVLVRHAEEVMGRLVDAPAELKANAGRGGGRRRLAGVSAPGAPHVAEAVTYFLNRYPDVRLVLREDDPEQYVPLIKANQLDLGLVFAYDLLPVRTDDGIERVLLLEDPIDVALPSGHVLADAAGVTLAQLAQEIWIASTRSSPVHRFTAAACEAAGFVPRVRFETDDYHVAQALVAAGLGVALLPRMAARLAHPGVAVRPLADPGLARSVFAAHRPGGDRAPAVAKMVDVLQRLAAAA